MRRSPHAGRWIGMAVVALLLAVGAAGWSHSARASDGDDGKSESATAGTTQETPASKGADKGAAKQPADPKTKSANEKSTAQPAAGDKPKAPPLGSFAEREATALEFARQHHPELVALLKTLRKSNRAEYQQAVRDLARTSDRLANQRDKDPQRYALQLEQWQVKSRIQVLIARASMSPGRELSAELRELLVRQHDVRVRLLQLDQAMLSEKLENTETMIERLESDPDRMIDRQLDNLLRGIDDTRARAAQRNARPAAARPSASKAGATAPPEKPKSEP